MPRDIKGQSFRICIYHNWNLVLSAYVVLCLELYTVAERSKCQDKHHQKTQILTVQNSHIHIAMQLIDLIRLLCWRIKEIFTDFNKKRHGLTSEKRSHVEKKFDSWQRLKKFANYFFH